MTNPTVDIIVPVWNNPFGTRACLAALLEHSPGTRLIIVDNGSSRETTLMLEEFSEPLGDRGLFISSDKNMGLVWALNTGLARSDSEYAVIVRPHVTVAAGWLDALLTAARTPLAGIVSPVFSGSGAPSVPQPAKGCTLAETFDASFSTLLIKGELHMLLGGFDPEMDGGTWCLKSYFRQAAARGYRTLVTSQTRLACGEEQQFGSRERRNELESGSRQRFREQWGKPDQHAVYWGGHPGEELLSRQIDTLLEGAREGHRYNLLLNRRIAAEFVTRGWGGVHTGIQTETLPFLMPQRALRRRLDALKAENPEIILVSGDGEQPPGCSFDRNLQDTADEAALELTEIELN